MDKDSGKWLTAGCAGALLGLIVLSVGGAFLFRYGAEELAIREDASPKTPEDYSKQAWESRAEGYRKEEAQRQARLEASGLTERYTVVPLHDDTRRQLYREQNFPEVEQRLTAQFEAADSPLSKYRYAEHIRSLGNFTYSDDPEALWAILDAWVEHSPESHLPYLIRGNFALNLPGYYRSGSFADRVSAYQRIDKSEDGWHRYLEQAQRDLEQSLTLKPDDIEAAAAMASLALATSQGHEFMERYFQKTMAGNPYHLDAYITKVTFALPRFGGSSEAVAEIIAEAESKYAAFPLIVRVKRYGEQNGGVEGALSYEATQQMMYESYKAQAALDPDDLFIRADLAFYGNAAGRFESAAAALDFLDTRFPDGCLIGPLNDFHLFRAAVYTAHAHELTVRDAPLSEVQFQKALHIAPDSSRVTILYLGHLARIKDDAKVQAFYERLQDPYLATGDWATPPNYTVMAAMAKAGRPDDDGIQRVAIQEMEQDSQHLAESLSLAPANPYVLMVNAEHLIRANQFEEAQSLLEKAREVAPDYLPPLHTMIGLYGDWRRFDEGIAAAQAFLDATPRDALSAQYQEENSAYIRTIKRQFENSK